MQDFEPNFYDSMTITDLDSADLYEQPGFSLWVDRAVYADCLRALELDVLADELLTQPLNPVCNKPYASIIKSVADRLRRQDVIETLARTCLINA